MDNCKYILIKQTVLGRKLETFYMFPPFIKHKDFCKNILKEDDTILSAGFVDLGSKNCYGRSSSLNIKSNPDIDNIYLSTLYKE
ncbi:MAG: hypothetical protein ACFFG0_01385 [Candidatus Thorarchaeota archaeon]